MARITGDNCGCVNQLRRRKVANFSGRNTCAQYGIKALDWVFQRPIFKTTDYIVESQIPEDTARRLLKVLEKLGIVQTLAKGSGRRSSTMVFAEFLNIAEGKEAF